MSFAILLPLARLIRGEYLLRLIGFMTADYDESDAVCQQITGNAFSGFSFSAVAIGAAAAFGASLNNRS